MKFDKIILANFVSRIFGPETTMSLVLWVLLHFYTDLDYKRNMALVFVLFVTNVVLPIVSFIALYSLGFISDVDASKREERPRLLVIIFLLNSVGFLFILLLGSPLYKVMSFAIYFSRVLITMITFYWKISLHMSVNTLVVLVYTSIWSIAAPIWILHLGLVAWSRLVLDKHSVMQLTLGCGVVAIVWYFVIGLAVNFI